MIDELNYAVGEAIDKHVDADALLTTLYEADAISARGAKIIREFPAVDAVEVRHGCWLPDKVDIEWGNYLIHYRCSECKKRPHFDKNKYKFILSPYCPNCGAKMD